MINYCGTCANFIAGDPCDGCDGTENNNNYYVPDFIKHKTNADRIGGRVMGEMMTFPETIQEFLEQYKIVDTEQVYTNGVELIPIFRVLQWYKVIDENIKPKTNADQIRFKMDDVDLAIFLDSVMTDGRINGSKYPCSKFGWLDWLKQEVDE